MNLSSVSPGDMVEIDHKGRRFYAQVRELRPRSLKVRPVTPGITHHEAKATEVIGIWHANKATWRRFTGERIAEVARGA